MHLFQCAWYCIGLWSLPSQPRRSWYTVYSIISNFIALFVFNVCILLSVLIANNIGDIVETFVIAASTVSALVKALIFLACRRDVSRLLDVMKQIEATSVNSPGELSILLAAKRRSVLATACFTINTVIAIVILFLNTLLQPKRALMWPSLYPIEWQSDDVYYAIVMIFQVGCTFFIGSTIIVCDMWRATAFFLIAGFLDVLRGRMQRLGYYNVNDLEEVQLLEKDVHEKELVECIKYHLLCIKYVYESNAIIKLTNLCCSLGISEF